MAVYETYKGVEGEIEMRPYEPGEEDRWVDRVRVSPRHRNLGSPKKGDMIARNTANPTEEWLVPAEEVKSMGVKAGSFEEETGLEDNDGPLIRNVNIDTVAREGLVADASEEAQKTPAKKEEVPPTPQSKPTEVVNPKTSETKPAPRQ